MLILDNFGTFVFDFGDFGNLGFEVGVDVILVNLK